MIYALRNKDTLAKSILEEIGKEGQKTRKYYQRRLPSDSSKDYYYMLRNTPNTESLIVEYGFLDTASDATRLKNNYKDYAEAVVRAVADYKNLNYVPISGSDYYIVKKGDTLWSIARDNNISVSKLKEINNLTSNSLSIGDILKLTDDFTTPSLSNTYTVNSGDTLYSIARKFNVSVNELKQSNNLTTNALSVGQVLTIPGIEIEPENTTETTYTVKSGDNLYSIAKTFNTTVTELKQANNLTSNTLSINQVLIIPNTSEIETPINGNKYIVKSGDTLYSIANKYNISVNELKQFNNLTSNTLSLNQELIIPSNIEENIIYTVKSGDTLYSIARNYNVSVNEIKTLNNLTSNALSIGQTLLIPG